MPPDASASTPSGVASLTAPRAAEILSRLLGRPPQAISLRVLQGRPRGACAAFFGIPGDAFDVMLLRAVQAFEAEAWPGTPRPPLLGADEEAAQAGALAQALEAGAAEEGAAPEVKRHARVLLHLRAMAPGVRAAMEAQEEALEASPRARREAWVRRGLVLLLMAAALYFYQRQQAAPPPRPARPRAAAVRALRFHPGRAPPRALPASGKDRS